MKIDEFSRWVRERQQDVEHALERWVSDESPAGLGTAMRYAVLDGGKRLRPLLVLAASDAVSGDRASALRAAVAVELIHAYSLVHDDMSDRVVILSAGPASRVVGEFRIDLARPRDVAEVRSAPRFVELHKAIWAVLREEVLAGYQQQLAKA